ncbi:MAG TPA: hypothetical protein VN428_23610, partial [Bryobacteraceae bacterium]|nr:hypothetical protein [Bryobacteraceae bacterium]
RNGMLLPLSGKPLELHYFPRLGAEFFLWEPDLDYISQFHASPTVDLLRLESESIKAREFDWVVHNLEPSKRVYQGSRDYRRVRSPAALEPGAWHYDAARKTLRVRVLAAEHGNEIVHVEFAKP